MRHAFVPMTNGSDRCARCLRHLDCVPHLPIAPSPMYPGILRALHIGTATENQRRVAASLGVSSPRPAGARAAR